MVNRDQKLALIDRVVAGRASEMFTNFLRVLARHDRLGLLPLILAQCGFENEKRSGKKRVQVISAQELPAGTLDKIRDRLAALLAFPPVLETAVDRKLLGACAFAWETPFMMVRCGPG